MKFHKATKRDDELGIMRCELSGDDVDLLVYASNALERLAKIEDILGVIGLQAPLGWNDLPTATREAAKLLSEFQAGWDGGVFEEMLERGEIVVVEGEV